MFVWSLCPQSTASTHSSMLSTHIISSFSSSVLVLPKIHSFYVWSAVYFFLLVIIDILGKFFTPVLTGGFSLKSQQISCVQNSLKYLSWFQQFYCLVDLHSSSGLTAPHSLFPTFRDWFKVSNYNWYHHVITMIILIMNIKFFVGAFEVISVEKWQHSSCVGGDIYIKRKTMHKRQALE